MNPYLQSRRFFNRKTGEGRFGDLCFLITRRVIWLRRRSTGPGFVLKRTALTFSERYGYHTYRRLPFGWRLARLRPFEPALPSGYRSAQEAESPHLFV